MTDPNSTPVTDVPQEFIDEHMKVCRAGKKKGKSENTSKRKCAISLYRYCKKLGIEPVQSHADIPEPEAA